MNDTFYGVISPGNPVKDKQVEELMKKYKDRINDVETKTAPLAVVKKLVDIEAYPMNRIAKIHLTILEQNCRHMPTYRGEKITLQFYKVLHNGKSRLYYDEFSTFGESMFQLYFEQPTMLIVFDEKLDLVESGSLLFDYDYTFLRGITASDSTNESLDLINYLAMIDSFETLIEEGKGRLGLLGDKW
ncbi:hypothetical protein [Marinilactibacillus kalidii]|uniref:hypothetical protein n=1 Tax=Marinilactibacillus kalidii TaxID=2820274 RepID=UPI001ABE25C2|nr:hypothetical protein [Marinilactibacillus kalidii]